MKFTLLIWFLIALAFPAKAETTNEERDLSSFFGNYSGAFVLLDAAHDHWLTLSSGFVPQTGHSLLHFQNSQLAHLPRNRRGQRPRFRSALERHPLPDSSPGTATRQCAVPSRSRAFGFIRSLPGGLASSAWMSLSPKSTMGTVTPPGALPISGSAVHW